MLFEPLDRIAVGLKEVIEARGLAIDRAAQLNHLAAELNHLAAEPRNLRGKSNLAGREVIQSFCGLRAKLLKLYFGLRAELLKFGLGLRAEMLDLVSDGAEHLYGHRLVVPVLGHGLEAAPFR